MKSQSKITLTAAIAAMALSASLPSCHPSDHHKSSARLIPADSIPNPPALQNASTGKIDRLYVYSSELGDTVTVDVWTPECYNADNDTRHPVIYMHDGQNLFDASTTWNHQAWEMDSVTGALISSGEITAPVIVGVHSVAATRLGDLMPQKALGYLSEATDTLKEIFLSRNAKDVRGDAYAKFMATSLKPLIDARYKVLTDRANTSVMGSSMGGLMSLYIMSEYPEIFGSAACLSTHWVGTIDGNPAFSEAMKEYVRQHLPSDGRHRLYLDRGTATIDSLYGPAQTAIIAIADSLGYNYGTNLDTLTATGASHMEQAWMMRVARPLRFLLSQRPGK